MPMSAGVAGAIGGAAQGVQQYLGLSAQQQADNAAAKNMFDFLSQGGGVDNANDIAKGEIRNYLSNWLGMGGMVSPDARAARAGRGPGGGLGVFFDPKSYIEENPINVEGIPWWKKALSIGLGAVQGATGG